MTETRATSADDNRSNPDSSDDDLSEAFEKAEQQLTSIVEAFRTGDVKEAVEKTLLTPEEGDERPIDSWSLSNRLLCYLAGTRELGATSSGRRSDGTSRKGHRRFGFSSRES